jgi:hypothetical protein
MRGAVIDGVQGCVGPLPAHMFRSDDRVDTTMRGHLIHDAELRTHATS